MTELVITMPDRLCPVDMEAAVNATWRAIRQRHRRVPDALVTIVAGPGLDGGLIDWSTPVIQLPAQTVSDGPEAVLQALLHQAAHGWLAVAGDQVPGRWHSTGFRDRATALLLDVQKHPQFGDAGFGWSETSLRDEAVTAYGDQIAQLAAASPDWVPPHRPPGSERSSLRNGVAATCACPDGLKIRIRGIDASARLAEHPVFCGICGKSFEPV
jgi:hypothetical protein